MLTRILLDTCTVRNLIHDIGAKLDSAEIIPKLWKYRISIADPAVGELYGQLCAGRVQFGDLHAKISELDAILDPNWPVFPGGEDLSAIAGLQTDLMFNKYETQLHNRERWQLARGARSMDEFLRGRRYSNSNGKVFELKPDPVHIAGVIDQRRNGWIDFVNDTRNAQDSGAVDLSSLVKIETYCLRGLGIADTDPADLGSRLELSCRLLARFLNMAINSKPRVDFGTVKRRGDLFDWTLLFATSLPAIVVTADKRFVNRLREIKLPDAMQILKVEEFNEHVRNDTIESLLRHRRSPEDQQRQWREAAYFHWLKRGSPIGEPLTDWVATEPLA